MVNVKELITTDSLSILFQCEIKAFAKFDDCLLIIFKKCFDVFNIDISTPKPNHAISASNNKTKCCF